MFPGAHTGSFAQTTTHKVVLPFYLYAAFSLLAGTILLFFSADAFTDHYFHPHTLAITHVMALGWGTMIILGASHQLVPVLIEGKLYSTRLAYASFILTAVGIPLLAYSFYIFDMDAPAKWGGRFVLLSVLCYMINLSMSMARRGRITVHAIFILTAAAWLFITCFLGLALVYNFTYPFLPKETLAYLPLHAHAGITGWFLLLITGVGSRLIPMFLISKYTNPKLLWVVYVLINGGLLGFFAQFFFFPGMNQYFIPVGMILLALLLFGYYCINCVRERIRRQVDEPMKFSLLSVMMMLLPLVFLISITGWLLTDKLNTKMVLIYGFTIFFGWITALIFGMTFKTLPFIVWNKVYHQLAGLAKTPAPKELFSMRLFIVMAMLYLGGFIMFITGVYLETLLVLRLATVALMASSAIYVWNVLHLVFHKPVIK